MPSADQVPVKTAHSTMRWHKVGCPDRRIDRLSITCCSPSQPNLPAFACSPARIRAQSPMAAVAPAVCLRAAAWAAVWISKCKRSELKRKRKARQRCPAFLHREQHHNGSAAIRDSSHGCLSQKNATECPRSTGSRNSCSIYARERAAPGHRCRRSANRPGQ